MDNNILYRILFFAYTAVMSMLFAFFICNYKKYEHKYSKFTRLSGLICVLLFGAVNYAAVAYEYFWMLVEYSRK